MRKGVHPCDYMDSPERFKETQLPPKEAFYSELEDEDITDEDYAHVQKVWKTFNMKTMRDYHDFYNKLDILQLADIFENFRKVCYKHCGLDPADYYTAPGLAFDAAFKVTRVELELPTDPDMLLMIEKGIRGGVSMISTRYGKSNNKYMGTKYDASKPSKYNLFLDVNDLYGWAMSKPLPSGGIEWINEEEFGKWRNYSCI